MNSSCDSIKMATPQETGYECEFVDNVKDYECPLCLHVTREPYLTTCCGQHFCQQCIQTIISTNKPCPFCKEDSFTTFLDKKQKRRVLDLKVYCEYKNGNCDWIGGLGELKHHLAKKCKYVLVNCPNNCGLVIPRLYLQHHHQSNECPKRPHTCKYCQLEGTYQDIEENHAPVCPKYPVSCPNKCEVSYLQRGQLEQHLRECPLAMVECELREVGCEERVQRKDLDRHMEQAARKHLTLSTNYFIKNLTKQAKEIAELRRENEKLQQNCYLLERQSKEQKTELALLTNQVKLFSDRVVRLNVNYNKWKHSTNNRWENSETFKTLSGYTMKINLYRYRCHWSSIIYVELTHVQSPMDDNLKWPKTFSMKVKLINQARDQLYHHDHHEVSGDDLQVTRGGMNDQVGIDCDIIESPPHGVQYIVDKNIKMEIAVAEK